MKNAEKVDSQRFEEEEEDRKITEAEITKLHEQNIDLILNQHSSESS